MYDRFADVYDRMMSETPYDIWFEKLTAYLERQGKTGGHLCELGCGTGEMTGRFARKDTRLPALICPRICWRWQKKRKRTGRVFYI